MIGDTLYTIAEKTVIIAAMLLVVAFWVGLIWLAITALISLFTAPLTGVLLLAIIVILVMLGSLVI